MANFNQSKWVNYAIQSFINTGEDFLKTIEGSVDVKENEKIIVPVFEIADSGIQEDGSDTVFVSPTRTAIEVDTDDEIKLGISFTRISQLSTNLSLLKLSAERVGKQIRKRLAKNVLVEMMGGAATAHKLEYDDADGGTSVTVPTFNMILKISELLTVAGCPLDNRFLVFPADFERYIFNMEDDKGNLVFINNAQLGNEVVYKGQIGMIKGFKVLLSDTMPQVTATGATTGTLAKDCFIGYYKDAAIYGAEKKIFVDEQFNNVKATTEVLSQLKYGKSVLHDTHIVQVREN